MMIEKQQTVSERSSKQSIIDYPSKSAAIKLIRQLTQAERSRKSDILQSKIKTLTEINNNLEQAIAKNQPGLEIFGQEKLIVYIRYCFLQNVSKVQPIRYLRLVMLNQTIIKYFLMQNIPLYISRNLDKQNDSRNQSANKTSNDQQNFQVLKFMNEWVRKFPLLFPKYLAGALIAYGQLPTVSQQKRKETKIPFSYKMFAIDIIMSLAIFNPRLCALAGGFTVLQSCVLDPTFYEKSIDMICKLIYFFNEKQTRQIIAPYVNLTKVFHIFTDLDSTFHQQVIKLKGGFEGVNKYQQQLSLAKSVIIAICKSWTGLIYIGNQKLILCSFLEALKQIPKKHNSQVRNVLFSIIEELLNIGNLFLIQRSKKAVVGKNNKSAAHQFKISSLLNSYFTTLLQLLIENNLFRILIELSGVQQNSLSEPAQKLLKKLTILIFNFFPDSSKYIDFLISAATVSSQKDALILKSSSSFIVNKIGNYVFEESKRKQQFSVLNLIERTFGNTMYKQFYRESTDSILQSLNFITHRHFNQSSLVALTSSTSYRKYLLDLDMITRDNKQKNREWKWDLIQEFLLYPSQQKLTQKVDSNEKYKQGKLFKYLLRYYSPSRERFILEKWSKQNFQYIKIGQLLIQNTVTIPQFVTLLLNPDFSQFQITINFVAQLQKLIQKVLSSVARSTKEFYIPFYKECERQLILWIPLFSYTKLGYERLLCQNNFFEIIYSYLNVPSCASIISAILHHMDFCRDNMAKKRIVKQKQDVNRSFSSSSNSNSLNSSFMRGDVEDKIIIGPKILLQKSIKQGSKALKLNCIQILKILFRLQLNNYSFEGMKLIVFFIRQNEGQVLLDSLELLNSLLSQKNNVDQFVKALQAELEISISSILNKIQKFSKQIIIKMVSTANGFKFIENQCGNWLEKQYENWMKSQQARSYCIQLESMLDDCLNFTKKSKSGLKIPNRKQYLDLLYLYRLPWIVYLNEYQYPLTLKLAKDSSNQFVLYVDFTLIQGNIVTITERRVQVSVGIGCIFIDENFNQVKNKYAYIVSLNSLFNNQRNKIGNLNDSYGNQRQLYISRNQGVSVFFTKNTVQGNLQHSYNIQRIQIQVNVQSNEEDRILPLHLIKQLSHTHQGINFLCERGFLSEAKRTLEKYETSYKNDRNSEGITLLDIRSVLWALGFFGSTSDGVQQIIENKILHKIIRMSFQSQTLSLRGTCRYVLNMFCYSEKGRNFLENNSYHVNIKTLSCYPKSSQDFFSIKTKNKQVSQDKLNNNKEISQKIELNRLKSFSLQYPNDQKYWESYKLQPMNQIETKVFNELSKLINNYLSTKNAVLEIRELQKNNYRIWYSVNLFRNVITLITFHKFKYDSRKKVLAFFDELIKSPQFNNEVEGKLNYGLIDQLINP